MSDSGISKAAPVMERPVPSFDPEKSSVIIDADADLGLQYMVKNGQIDYTEEEERRVRWKIDLFLLPVVSISLIPEDLGMC